MFNFGLLGKVRFKPGEVPRLIYSDLLDHETIRARFDRPLLVASDANTAIVFSVNVITAIIPVSVTASGYSVLIKGATGSFFAGNVVTWTYSGTGKIIGAETGGQEIATGTFTVRDTLSHL